MCVAQGNLTGRLLGDNFKKLDPLMAAGERFDSNHVAPLWKGTSAPAPAPKAPPGLSVTDSARRKPDASTARAVGGSTMLGQ